MDQFDTTVEEVPIPLFKPTASARETAARGRRLLLRTGMQAAGVIARARFLGNASGLKTVLLDDEEARLGLAGSAPPLIPNTE
jgi:hypothetical protein